MGTSATFTTKCKCNSESNTQVYYFYSDAFNSNYINCYPIVHRCQGVMDCVNFSRSISRSPNYGNTSFHLPITVYCFPVGCFVLPRKSKLFKTGKRILADIFNTVSPFHFTNIPRREEHWIIAFAKLEKHERNYSLFSRLFFNGSSSSCTVVQLPFSPCSSTWCRFLFLAMSISSISFAFPNIDKQNWNRNSHYDWSGNN